MCHTHYLKHNDRNSQLKVNLSNTTPIYSYVLYQSLTFLAFMFAKLVIISSKFI